MTVQRLTTAERLTALETMVGEIHTAVVGDGSRGSTVRERLAAVETQNDWRHRAVYGIVPSLAVAILSHLGIHVPNIGGQS